MNPSPFLFFPSVGAISDRDTYPPSLARFPNLADKEPTHESHER